MLKNSFYYLLLFSLLYSCERVKENTAEKFANQADSLAAINKKKLMLQLHEDTLDTQEELEATNRDLLKERLNELKQLLEESEDKTGTTNSAVHTVTQSDTHHKHIQALKAQIKEVETAIK